MDAFVSSVLTSAVWICIIVWRDVNGKKVNGDEK